mgnify:CR=1 FL=1
MKKQKETLSEELDSYIRNYKRKSGFFPGAVPISDKEKVFITELIVKHQSQYPSDGAVYYEVSNNPEIDTILVWSGIELFIHEEAQKIRNSLK